MYVVPFIYCCMCVFSTNCYGMWYILTVERHISYTVMRAGLDLPLPSATEHSQHSSYTRTKHNNYYEHSDLKMGRGADTQTKYSSSCCHLGFKKGDDLRL